MVAIYALLVCKISGLKIWSCNFFDKSHVCFELLLVTNSLLANNILTHAPVAPTTLLAGIDLLLKKLVKASKKGSEEKLTIVPQSKIVHLF